MKASNPEVNSTELGSTEITSTEANNTDTNSTDTTNQSAINMAAETFDKLVELAGGEAQAGVYLAHLIALLHEKKCGQGGKVELEQAVVEIHELLQNERRYRQEIRRLEERLSNALANHKRISETMNMAFCPLWRTKMLLH